MLYFLLSVHQLSLHPLSDMEPHSGFRVLSEWHGEVYDRCHGSKDMNLRSQSTSAADVITLCGNWVSLRVSSVLLLRVYFCEFLFWTSYLRSKRTSGAWKSAYPSGRQPVGRRACPNRFLPPRLDQTKIVIEPTTAVVSEILSNSFPAVVDKFVFSPDPQNLQAF